MRNLITIMMLPLASLFFLTSCKGYGKSGDGHITTEQRTVQPFTQLSIEGFFPVEITQTGEPEGVKVTTDENLQNEIAVTNDGNKLVIKARKKSPIQGSGKMKVVINIKDLRNLGFSSVGNLNTTGILKLDSLEINSESIGKLNFNIKANFLRANLNAVGATTLTGTVREARINNESVGTLSAYDLKAGTLMIHNTAVGTVEVYADSAFYIRSSAIGILYYKGPGVVKELSSEGIGKVKKAD